MRRVSSSIRISYRVFEKMALGSADSCTCIINRRFGSKTVFPRTVNERPAGRPAISYGGHAVYSLKEIADEIRSFYEGIARNIADKNDPWSEIYTPCFPTPEIR